jgi:hypothetical protein
MWNLIRVESSGGCESNGDAWRDHAAIAIADGRCRRHDGRRHDERRDDYVAAFVFDTSHDCCAGASGRTDHQPCCVAFA